jgi:predicted aldo/keto reductase-like oxidoreductase
MSRRPQQPDLARRRFLISGAAATLSLGVLDLGGDARAIPSPPKIRRRRRLGRTGLEISDISFGSSRTTDPDLVRHALERGVNYFDTAEGYQDGRAEETIGEALQGKRDRVFLASKVKAGQRARRAEIMESLEGSLRRLRTDYIDVYFNHAVNDVSRLQNGEWLDFVDRARAQGKIRFTGISGHGGRLVECLDHALDNDLVDVILCGYNFGQDPSFHQRFTSRLDWVAVQPDLPRVLEKAHGKGVGVIAMKTLRGARLNDMRPYEEGGATFAQAAFRWVLSNPNVDALVISMKSREEIDEFVGASGGPEPRGADLDLLDGYLSSSGDGYCNHGCDACEVSCPHGVPVSEVLRTRMYATDYGDRDYARREYAQLAVDAASCASCALRPCLGRCPQGLEIPRLTRSAHRLLGRPRPRDPVAGAG